ncbi:MAG: RNA-directed DNA polymerase [Candidatus Omnitrophica bacterium]|nr:RNA-directed DNA polymerase [Candidatus Omnitrophota bacterium]
MKTILKYTHLEARRYFLKEESYFNFDLPPYFNFQNLITKLSKKMDNKLLSDFYGTCKSANTKKIKATYPSEFEDVNYKLLNNKDGRFAWRPFQLIHPAIYVSLVHRITEEQNWKFIIKRFKDFSKNPRISCFSIPLESNSKTSDKARAVMNWWHSIEQRSIGLALEYEYILHTDISDCYGSLYTHTIPWALHSKKTAKEERDNKQLIGNVIDKHLQDMSFGQTNGIPQGSALMDFIAEMVLGYADLELSKRVKRFKLDDFQILRYRDDYRILANNPQDAEFIVKHITEIMIDLGMQLSAKKTLLSSDVVQDSIKPDKLFWLSNKKETGNLQKDLLLIHNLSKKHPNSGSLTRALHEFFYRVENIKKTKRNSSVLISIIIDIAYKNPRTYPVSAAILSKLVTLIGSEKEQSRILALILRRFEKIPNTGYLQIWLQRVLLKTKKNCRFNECLCKKVINPSVSIWNSDWLKTSLKNIISFTPIVDKKIIQKINKTIDAKEVELFELKSGYTY